MENNKVEELLKFGEGNSKLEKDTLTFSLPAGHACPGANECLAFANPANGSITDGKNQKFRCFAASAECVYPSVREARWLNYNLLRYSENVHEMTKLIKRSVVAAKKRYHSRVRVHVSGDFFSTDYFVAWMAVANSMPDLTFYAYTKSIHIWVRHQLAVPKNFKLVASVGGRFDAMIETHKLRNALVVSHPDEAAALGLSIDHDDELAVKGNENFALLLHGVQPKNSKASESLSTMRKENIKFAYSSK